MKKKLLIVQKILTPFLKSKAGVYASACCYYLLLSIPAGVVVILSLLSLFEGYNKGLLSYVTQRLSIDSLPLLHQMLSSSRDKFSAGILSVSFVTAAWSAAKGISSLFQGLHTVLDIPANNFIHRRIWSVVTIIISVPLTLLILLLLGSANFVLENITAVYSHAIPSSVRIFANPSLISFAMLTPILTIIYGSVLKEHKKTKVIYVSSLISVLCIFVSVLYSHYLQHFNANTEHYSLFTIVLATMVWIRTLVLIILYGAIVYKKIAEKNYHPIRILMNALKSNNNNTHM